MAAEELVVVCRELLESSPTEFRADLADLLSELSVRLSDAGRPRDGLAALEEAVTVQRGLAEEDPEDCLPGLGASLTNLSVRLSGLGERQRAMDTIVEAVALYRRLPATPRSHLASVFNTMAVQLGFAGRYEEASGASNEAVANARAAAVAGDAASRALLATCLVNSSNWTDAAGDYAQAAVAAQEAVAIARDLTGAGYVEYVPMLAGSLTNLALEYQGLGRLADALAAAGEAVDLGAATNTAEEPTSRAAGERTREPGDVRTTAPAVADAGTETPVGDHQDDMSGSSVSGPVDLASTVHARANREADILTLLRRHAFDPTHLSGIEMRHLRQITHEVSVDGLTVRMLVGAIGRV